RGRSRGKFACYRRSRSRLEARARGGVRERSCLKPSDQRCTTGVRQPSTPPYFALELRVAQERNDRPTMRAVPGEVRVVERFEQRLGLARRQRITGADRAV